MKKAILEAFSEIDTEIGEQRQLEYKRISAKLKMLVNKQTVNYDMFIGGTIKEEMWEKKHQELESEIEELEDQKDAIHLADNSHFDLLKKLLELPKRLTESWSYASDEEKRQIIKLLYSNCTIQDKVVSASLIESISIINDFAKFEKWGG